MAQKLLIVESPSKCKTISKYLGKDYIVRPTMGHVCDLTTTGKFNLGVDLENDFKPKYKISSDKKDKLAAIFEAATRVDTIYLAADKDREGEAIAWHVYNELKKKKINKTIKRITFDEITKSSLEKALNNPRDLDKHLYDAQQARRVLDRIVGFLASPFLINIFQTKLSAGRVQSVALKLIVDREDEIKNFNPETYFNINATLSKNKGEKFQAKYPKKIKKESEAKKIKQDLDDSTFSVKSVEKKEVNKNPPAPLTTSKMQQLASSRFKFKASKTMQIAQKLYEAGAITYIRTDSVRSSKESIDSVRKWLKVNKFDSPKTFNIYKNKDKSQDAHEAIRPTNIDNTPKIFVGASDEVKLYTLIWEHFVASQMTPAVFDTVTATIHSSKGHDLIAQGKTLKYKGWLGILKDFKDKDIKLPNLNKNDKLNLVPPKVKLEKKETQPPSRYSEGTLIKELEKKGIGRPSTYAAIIDKISKRSYVSKEKNCFVPTDTGEKLVNKLSEFFSFMKYEYTADMEKQLDKIADGKLKYVNMLSSFYNSFSEELKTARKSIYSGGEMNCEKCGEVMVLRNGKYGHFIACSGYPECKNIKSAEVKDGKVIIKKGNKKAQDKQYSKIKCPDCNSPMIKRTSSFGEFYGCSKYPNCKGIKKVKTN